MTKENLTFGERACGCSFNPGGNVTVNQIKGFYAMLVDSLNDKRKATEDAEVARMLSIAITEAQTSQMWAVKAVTWNL